MASRSLYEHIASNTEIARYAVHAQRLLRYQRYLETVLPPALRPHSHVANLRADKLVIYTSNAAVASKVRQLAPRLAGVFAAEGVKISEIDVRVQVSEHPRAIEKPYVAKPLPSSDRQKALADLAGRLPETSALKAPLARLLKTLKGR